MGLRDGAATTREGSHRRACCDSPDAGTGPGQKRRAASHRLLGAAEETGRGLAFPLHSLSLPTALLTQDLKWHLLGGLLASWRRQPTLHPAFAEHRMRAGNFLTCVCMHASVSPPGTQPQGQRPSLPAPPLESSVCTSHAVCLC